MGALMPQISSECSHSLSIMESREHGKWDKKKKLLLQQEKRKKYYCYSKKKERMCRGVLLQIYN